MNRGFRGADFLLRHRTAAEARHLKFVGIAIEDTADPGPFTATEQRTIRAGEAGTHVIVAAVWAHLKLRWVITAGSRHRKVEYLHEPTNIWADRTHSDIFGDDVISQYDSDTFPELAQPPTRAPRSLLDAFAAEARFGIRHVDTTDPCNTLPHEVESKTLVGGYHEGVGIAHAFSEDSRATSRTRCR